MHDAVQLRLNQRSGCSPSKLRKPCFIQNLDLESIRKPDHALIDQFGKASFKCRHRYAEVKRDLGIRTPYLDHVAVAARAISAEVMVVFDERCKSGDVG
jgi:hypothetical protein